MSKSRKSMTLDAKNSKKGKRKRKQEKKIKISLQLFATCATLQNILKN